MNASPPGFFVFSIAFMSQSHEFKGVNKRKRPKLFGLHISTTENMQNFGTCLLHDMPKSNVYVETSMIGRKIMQKLYAENIYTIA